MTREMVAARADQISHFPPYPIHDDEDRVRRDYQNYIYFGSDKTNSAPLVHLQNPLNHVTNLNPVLTYVNMTIGIPTNRGPHRNCHGAKLKCLLDTGCAKTSIDKSIYEFLMACFNNRQHDITEVNVQIVSCTGELKTIEGMCKLRLFLSTDPLVYRDLTAMVVDSLSEDVILGNELINSSWTQALTKNFWIMKNNDRKHDIQLPLLKEYMDLIPCKNMTMGRIVPCKTLTIAHTNQCRTPLFLENIKRRENSFSTENEDIPLHENKETTQKEIISQIDKPQIKQTDRKGILKTSKKEKEKLEQIYWSKELRDQTKRYNTKNKLDHLKKGHRNHFITTEYPDLLRKINFGQNEKTKQLKCHNETIVTYPKDLSSQINSDVEMNEIEKDYENDILKQKGFYQPSITQYLDDKSAVTELGLEDTSPITPQQFLNMFDIDHLPPKEKHLAQQIFLQHSSAFSLHKYDIGKTKLIDMDIQLNKNEPKMQKYVPIPIGVRDQAKDILDQLLQHDIIRVCDEPSPYCSNILVIKKKDGKSIRLLFDGRLLNYDTVRLPMALISKPEIMAHLINRTHLTSLDFADAFFHIPLSKEAQPLTAFYAHTHGLRMCFTRAPQGLRNSPLYLKLLLDKIFRDMTDSILFYADDLLVASDGTLEEHLLLVKKVLGRLEQAGLKLRPQKLLIAKDHIEFLGMVFQKDSISIPEAKLEAFKNLPSPNTPKKALSLICCLSFYRQFCPRFAELSRDIMSLAKLHPKQFQWNENLEKNLRLLISTICDNATLYIPDPLKTFYVQSDASQFCAAGRIFQKNEKGEEQLIAAVSRTFTKTEQHYSIFKKEILALLYSLKSMDYFLRYANKLVLYVDAKGIIFLRLAKESSGILLRFSLELSKYDAEIFHIPGEENIVSDVLSRHHPQIDKLIEHNDNNATISEKESIKLVNRLILPKGFQLTEEETKHLLNGPSPPAVNKKKTIKTKAGEGHRLIKNVPDTLTNKKLNLPKTTNYRPGMNLPVQVAKKVQNSNSQKQKKVTFDLPPVETKKRQSVRKRKERNSQMIDLSDTDQSTDIDEEFKENFGPVNFEERNITGFGSLNENEENFPPFDSDIRLYEDMSDQGSQDFDDQFSDSQLCVENDDNYQQMDIDNDLNQIPMEIDTDTQSQTSDHNQDMDILNYTDVQTVSNIITDGLLTIAQFKQAQQQDEFCCDIIEQGIPRKSKFMLIDGLLFRNKPDGVKLVLPVALYDTVIFTKHFTAFGSHNSASRIERDTKANFYISSHMFQTKIKNLIKNCYICQLFKMDCPSQEIKRLPCVNAPRISWSIDMITDTPKSKKGNNQILLCVDDFTSFVVCIPVNSATTENVLEALKTQLFAQFGIPKIIRSDQQATFYNSNLFSQTLTNLGIQLQATAVASPFSNSRAESQIKNIKHLMRKFLYQEHLIENWDDYISILTASHNKSVGIYGVSAEELMFGIRLPSKIDLVSFDNNTTTQEEYTQQIFERAEKVRKEARQRMDNKAKLNRSYKNKNKLLKEFEIGALVLHKQLQASTGTSSKYKPLYTGPYTILKINKDRCTALLEHLKTGHIIKAHFTNMQYLYYDPQINKLSDQYAKTFFYLLQDKYSLDKYKDSWTNHPGSFRSSSPEY